jgi:hypothetical protein
LFQFSRIFVESPAVYFSAYVFAITAHSVLHPFVPFAMPLFAAGFLGNSPFCSNE